MIWNRGSSSGRRSGIKRVRLAVETLEDRSVPTTFTVTTVADSGAGSLRQAILSANNNLGTDSIAFAIPGSGVQTIQPVTPLPTITEAISINGFTQPGSQPNTAGPGQPNNAVYNVHLDGSKLLGYNFPNGLTISAGSSSVRGMFIQFFRGTGMVFSTNGGNVIAGNMAGIAVQSGNGNTIGGLTPADQNLNGKIGVSSNNNVIVGNISFGVFVAGSNNQVGGTTPEARNVISGNIKYGVQIPGSNNRVEGNYIGTDVTGTVAVRNRQAGIFITGTNNTIGGTSVASRNILSGNHRGVYIYGGSQNTVLGNWIGIGATVAPLGNTSEGVLITNNGAGNVIGGTAAGAGNVISANRTGVTLYLGATGNLIQGNKIGTLPDGVTTAGNTYAGILIASNASGNTIGGTAAGAGNIIAFTTGIAGMTDSGHGIFAQSAPDAGLFPIKNAILGNAIFSNAGLGIQLSPGANQNQAAPVIQSATTSGSTTTIRGTLTSTPNSTFRLELFSNVTLDPSGFGEGQTLVASVLITTGANGVATFTVTVPAIPAGRFVTGTATSVTGNTSKFSRGVRV